MPDETALRAVGDRLTGAGAAFVSIVETDAPHTGQLMAIGVRPNAKEVLRPALSALPLLR